MSERQQVGREAAEAISEGLNYLAGLAVGKVAGTPLDVETLAAMRSGLVVAKCDTRVTSNMVVDDRMLSGLDEMIAEPETPSEAVQLRAMKYLSEAWPDMVTVLDSFRASSS